MTMSPNTPPGCLEACEHERHHSIGDSDSAAKSCWTAKTHDPLPSSTGSCWAFTTAQVTSHPQQEPPTREATTGWCCATPPAPPGWRSSRWRTCQSRHGRRDLDRRCCTSIPPFQAWATCVFSMTACLLSGRAFSSTDPTMKMSPCTFTPTQLGTHFVSSWLHSWVRRGVLDSQERPA